MTTEEWGGALAALNAGLNGLAGVLALAAFAAVRRGRVDLHWRFMVAALAASTLFLASYLARLALTGTHRFEGPDWLRATYLFILATHVVLATVIVPLVLRTVWLGARRQVDRHRRLARWTLPAWLYVSVTGVLIYVLLYRVGH